MFASKLILDLVHFVQAFSPAVPSSASPKWLDLHDAECVGIKLNVYNATTVTGAAITVNQATDNAGTSSKAVAFTDYYSVLDAQTAGSDAPWTRNTATGNTFTTLSTNSKDAYYFIPIDPSTLDINNGFTHLQVGIGNGTACTISAEYVVRPKLAGNPALMHSMTL